VAVVQEPSLEAEAERMGRLAASHQHPVQLTATPSSFQKNSIAKAQFLPQTVQRRVSIGDGRGNTLAKKKVIISRLREQHDLIRQKAAARFVNQGAGNLADVLWALNDVTPLVNKLAEILAHKDVDLNFVDWNEALDFLIPIVVPYDPVPIVVALSEQTTQKQVSQMIQLPAYATLGRLLFQTAGGLIADTHVFKPGNRRVFCRYKDEFERMGEVRTIDLNIKPTIAEVMTEMGFTEHGWRWDLAYGFHGVLKMALHLTVPKDGQSIPDDYAPWTVAGLKAMFDGLFPLGTGYGGTHMTLACRRDPSRTNASAFLNGNDKDTNEYYEAKEKTAFTKACRSRLAQWRKDAYKELSDALKRLQA
jgi:hypothetical protein